MRTAALAVIGALSLGAAARPALAQAPADKSAARCLLVLQAIVQDPKNRDSANQGTTYYLGYLMAHGYSGKMEPLLEPERKAIKNPQQVQAELTRCGAELNARGAELRAVFANLQQNAVADRLKAGVPPPPK